MYNKNIKMDRAVPVWSASKQKKYVVDLQTKDASTALIPNKIRNDGEDRRVYTKTGQAGRKGAKIERRTHSYMPIDSSEGKKECSNTGDNENNEQRFMLQEMEEDRQLH